MGSPITDFRFTGHIMGMKDHAKVSVGCGIARVSQYNLVCLLHLCADRRKHLVVVEVRQFRQVWPLIRRP